MSRDDDRRYDDQRRHIQMQRDYDNARRYHTQVQRDNDNAWLDYRKSEQDREDKKNREIRVPIPSPGQSPSHSESYSTPPDPVNSPWDKVKKVGRGIGWATLFGLAVVAVVEAVKQKATEPDSLPSDGESK